MSVSRVLITGGAGFVGSELTRQAVQMGWKITVVDNLRNGRREYLQDLPKDQVELVVADIRDVPKMRTLMSGVDVVYHLACLCVRHSIHSPQENHDVNATGSLLLLGLARELGINRFVYTSSAEVYGSACTGAVAEDNTLKPTNPYAGAKLAAESYAQAFHICYGMPTVVLRLFNCFGTRSHQEGDCGEVIPKFMLRSMAGKSMVVFGDGKQTRDFNFVEDTASAILSAGLCDAAIGQIINIGSGIETSVNHLAATIKDVVANPNVPIVHDAPRPGDIARMYADGTKARQLLGYAPRISLRDGLLRLKQWYESRSESANDLLKTEIVHNWELAAK
jgi:UDP-glucose 4-epimerase